MLVGAGDAAGRTRIADRAIGRDVRRAADTAVLRFVEQKTPRAAARHQRQPAVPTAASTLADCVGVAEW